MRYASLSDAHPHDARGKGLFRTEANRATAVALLHIYFEQHASLSRGLFALDDVEHDQSCTDFHRAQHPRHDAANLMLACDIISALGSGRLSPPCRLYAPCSDQVPSAAISQLPDKYLVQIHIQRTISLTAHSF